MGHITLVSPKGGVIHFDLDEAQAPITCEAFRKALPFVTRGVQARFAGEEIWVQQGPDLAVPVENATTQPHVGDLGYVPSSDPNSLGTSVAIIYGDAHLSAPANIFAHVRKENLSELKHLGEAVWLEGAQELKFEWQL